MMFNARKRIDASAGQGSKPARNRRLKNWLAVNIGEHEAKALRALAECYGVELRSFLEFAIRSKAREVAEIVGVETWDALKIPRQRRREMGRRFRDYRLAIGGCNAGKN
jgi:hypothetical protein